MPVTLKIVQAFKGFQRVFFFFPTLFTLPLSHSFIKKVNCTHKKVLIAISLLDVWSFSFFVTFGIISKEAWKHIHSQKCYHWGSILMHIWARVEKGTIAAFVPWDCKSQRHFSHTELMKCFNFMTSCKWLTIVYYRFNPRIKSHMLWMWLPKCDG